MKRFKNPFDNRVYIKCAICGKKIPCIISKDQESDPRFVMSEPYRKICDHLFIDMGVRFSFDQICYDCIGKGAKLNEERREQAAKLAKEIRTNPYIPKYLENSWKEFTAGKELSGGVYDEWIASLFGNGK